MSNEGSQHRASGVFRMKRKKKEEKEAIFHNYSPLKTYKLGEQTEHRRAEKKWSTRRYIRDRSERERERERVRLRVGAATPEQREKTPFPFSRATLSFCSWLADSRCADYSLMRDIESLADFFFIFWHTFFETFCNSFLFIVKNQIY